MSEPSDDGLPPEKPEEATLEQGVESPEETELPRARFENGQLVFEDSVSFACFAALQQRMNIFGTLIRFTMNRAQEVEDPDELARELCNLIMIQADADGKQIESMIGMTLKELQEKKKEWLKNQAH